MPRPSSAVRVLPLVTSLLLAAPSASPFLAGCGASRAASPTPTSASALPVRAPAEEIYDLSPLRLRVRGVAGQAYRMLAPHWSGLRESDQGPIQEAVVATFSEAKLAPLVKKHLADAAAADPARAEEALAWLRGELAYEVKFAEATSSSSHRGGASASRNAERGDEEEPGAEGDADEAASPRTPSSEDLFAEQVALVREKAAPEVRMERIRRLGEATEALPVTLDYAEHVGTVVARLVARARPGVPPPAEEQLRKAVDRERAAPAVVNAYRDVVDAALLLRCRELDLADLDAYIAFAESDAGRWYHRAIAQALDQAIVEAGVRAQAEFELAASHGGTGAHESRPGFDLDSLQVTLPSGRKVRLLAMAAVGASAEAAFVLRYETSLPLSDAAALRDEAREVWQHLRTDPALLTARAAVLQATGDVEGWVFPQAASRRFGWRRGKDGAWSEVADRSFGEVRREVLWATTP